MPRIRLGGQLAASRILASSSKRNPKGPGSAHSEHVRRSPSMADLSLLIAGLLCISFLGGTGERGLLARETEPGTSVNVREAKEPLRQPGTELAWVEDIPIHLEDVRREVQRAIGDRPIHPGQLPRLYRETLELLIDRQLVLRFLERQGRAATPQDLDLAMQRWQRQLESVGETTEEFTVRQRLTLDDVRAAYYWTLSWRRMLDHYVTERNLERYFDQHRADYDGRRIRVAQIFWRAEPDMPLSKLRETAEDIRRRVLEGELAFDEAARRYSQSPSAEQGGELGWIERHDPMPETFSAAAFRLKAGEISPLVVTTLGLHLMQCQEIEPGTREWLDERPKLERGLVRYLFRWAADNQRERSQVRRRDPVDWKTIAR